MIEEKKQVEKESRDCDMRKGIKTVAGTAAGSSIGIAGAVTMAAILATEHIVLPVAVCVWAFGIAGGAIGMIIGLGRDKKGCKVPKDE